MKYRKGGGVQRWRSGVDKMGEVLSGEGAMIYRVIFLLLVSLGVVRGEVWGELRGLTGLKNWDEGRLMGGEVVTGRGPALSFGRGLAVESLYVVRASVGKTLERQRQWTPEGRAGLKVWIHGGISGRPVAEDFRKIGSAPANGSVKALVAATEKIGEEHSGIYGSREEAKGFGRSGLGGWGGPMGGVVGGYWGEVLWKRAEAFRSGGLGKQPGYFYHGQVILAGEELGRLLKEVPKVQKNFEGLIGAMHGGGGVGRTGDYWELFDVDGVGAFSLGAVAERVVDGGAQVFDLQYYGSGGFFVMATFYQMWAIEVEGKAATLVWRGDYLASPILGELKGMERMGSGAVMMKRIKQGVGEFLGEMR